MIQVGLKLTGDVIVTDENTAARVGSGLLPVFATPSMIALIENTCAQCVQPSLEEGCTTVGTHLDVYHTSATPLGMKVTCTCELTEIDRRRLVFAVRCSDEAGEIGTGIHERFIVQSERFMEKASGKLK